MARQGSIAHDDAIRWSKILSEAIDLLGYDFDATSIAEARATYDRMDNVVDDDTDHRISSRLRLFERVVA
jgi:hypothetical protein